MVLIKMDSSLTDQPGEDFEITFGNLHKFQNPEEISKNNKIKY